MFWRGILYILVFLVCLGCFAKVRSAKIRQTILLLASYGLYLSWEYWFAAVLLTSTVMNYFLGKQLRRKPSGFILTIGVVLNVALLSAFKYFPGVAISLPFASLQGFSHLALPLGISFWTFQGIGYLFDLYREEELDPTFPEFALFMVFFPVTISGPVCRMPDMLPQFRSNLPIAWKSICRGVCRIATGVLMMQTAKMLGQGILAGDGIGSGFDHVTQWTGPDVWCLAFGYGLQLFLDFAGYTHIAIGAAEALGFSLPENFARPFQSTTPSIFWTRWHMSLSFWIRDYLFLPLATLRRELWWRNLALVISMIVFGLWHKASVLFLVWGCYHGVLLVLHRFVQQLERRFERPLPVTFWNGLSWVVTMGLIHLGWIFFRANSLAQAGRMLSAIFSPVTYGAHILSGSLYLLVGGVAAGYAVVLLVVDAMERSTESADTRTTLGGGLVAMMARSRWFWIPPLYAMALIFVLIVTLARGTTTAQMMYGNF